MLFRSLASFDSRGDSPKAASDSQGFEKHESVIRKRAVEANKMGVARKVR